MVIFFFFLISKKDGKLIMKRTSLFQNEMLEKKDLSEEI